MSVEFFAELGKKGLTLIYGPPGAGKTAFALRIASRAERPLWISTSEGEAAFSAATKRLAVAREKIDFYDFPRAFRDNVLKFIAEHIGGHDMLVVDSVTGLAEAEPDLEKTAHSFFYQLSKDIPVVLTSEGDPGKLAYIADNMVEVNIKRNAIGHIIRTAQLVKSRYAPPSERFIFDIAEGIGIVYFYTKKAVESAPPVEVPAIGEMSRGSVIGVFGPREDDVLAKLKELTEGKNVLYVHMPGIIVLRKADVLGAGWRIYPISTFQELASLALRLALGQEKADVLVFSGLSIINKLSLIDLLDYITVLSALGDYVEYVILAELANKDEVIKSPLYMSADYRIFLEDA